MGILIRQFTSLDKVFEKGGDAVTKLSREQVLLGERFSYQLGIRSPERMQVELSVESELSEYIQVYQEEDAVCDMPSYREQRGSLEYLTHEPCRIPDILKPLSGEERRIRISERERFFWIRVDVPCKMDAGSYPIVIAVCDLEGNRLRQQELVLEVLPVRLPETELLYTQWFHTDCIAAVHDVKIYSPKHWQLIEAYIKTAADCGINMILTPVHTPPLDTEVGTERPNVQLMKVEKTQQGYQFDFGLLEKWVGICQTYGISHFEMPHLFSQWGLTSAPNIYVTENGEYKHMFGWHTASDSPEYTEFLRQYLPALVAELKRLGIADSTYFHISDEPSEAHLANYEKCVKLVREILKDEKIIDALSDIAFYKKGLVEIPVPASNHIEPFLREDLRERWVYYCCGQNEGVSNRFLAMSSYQNRVMGILLYKFQITGFLQWGYNFYFSERSGYVINPYLTTSGDEAFPSGDPFSVYPAPGGALPSMRAFVFYEGLQDLALCKALEEKKGRAYVAALIDEVAGKDVRFASLPEGEDYLYRLRERMRKELGIGAE